MSQNKQEKKMKRSIISGVIVITMTAGALCSYGSTNYWDNNGDMAGFGNANGTWGVDSNWSTNSLGASEPIVTNTTTADVLHFGTLSGGLASGTISVNSTNQSFNTMTFGAASGAITLTNGTLNLGAPLAKIATYNSSNTIATVLAGASDLYSGFYKVEDLNYNEFLATTNKVLFHNATPIEFTAVYGVFDGISIGNPLPAKGFNLVNTGTSLTCQMQALENLNLKCVKIELTQDGNNIK